MRCETRRYKKLSPYIFYFGVFLLMLMPPLLSLLLSFFIFVFLFSTAFSTSATSLHYYYYYYYYSFACLPPTYKMYIMLKINISIKFFSRANDFYVEIQQTLLRCLCSSSLVLGSIRLGHFARGWWRIFLQLVSIR